jgi:tetratricopeptide (TPR) repeat protein
MKPRKRKKKKAQNALSGAAPSQDQLNLLLAHYQANRFVEAEALGVSLTQQFPSHPFAWQVLGAVFKKMNRLNESLAPKQKAAELSPHDASAHSNLGNTLKELGRLNEAEASYRQAINLKPEFAEAHFNLGATLQELGRSGEAEAAYQQAIAMKPDYAQAHNNLGVTCKEQRKFNEAEAGFRRAIALNFNNAPAHNNLGIMLAEQGRIQEAEASYKRAIEVQPSFADAHYNLTTIKKFLPGDEQFLQMQAIHDDHVILDDDRSRICFALAKASDGLGEIEDAFQFYEEGNSIRKKELGYDKAQEERRFERLKATYPRLAALSLEAEIVVLEPTPIFIVGMPRSGTTLVEQIISSHPVVTGAGELRLAAQFGSRLAAGSTEINLEVLTAFKEKYTGGLRQFSEGKAIVTDKMPQNFALLGLITATLPDAKIIHVTRDPAALCWANYTQYFTKTSLRYCYSLDDILHYHDLYQDLMEYWHQAFPNRIYDLDYEGLTEHQEEETRKLIGHLKLRWDDACLSPQDNKRGVATASNAQVRQKVYQGSSDKWKRYRPYLNGALDHFSVANE